MSEIGWMLLAQLLPLMTWLQLVPSATAPGQAAAVLLGAVLVVALATAVARRARRSLASFVDTPGVIRSAVSSAPMLPQRAARCAGAVASGGRGARAPGGCRIHRFEDATSAG